VAKNLVCRYFVQFNVITIKELFNAFGFVLWNLVLMIDFKQVFWTTLVKYRDVRDK